MTDLQNHIEKAWDKRDEITVTTKGESREAVEAVIEGLDDGTLKIAKRQVDGTWAAQAWVKKAILLSFRLMDNEVIPSPNVTYESDNPQGYDKIPSKFKGWSKQDFKAANIRIVPGAFVRKGSYIAPDCVVMPSFINLGAHIGEKTMIDTWSTIGSCAQIGKNVHISGGVGIGGVLEPLQANPVIIEDGCFIGARSEVAEGVIVREGAVLSMGVYLGASTKIIDRSTGETFQGEVPAYAVVVPGALPGKTLPNGQPGPNLYCAVIVKRVDASTRAKTSLNELLRT